jgi:hypothetical protein
MGSKYANSAPSFVSEQLESRVLLYTPPIIRYDGFESGNVDVWMKSITGGVGTVNVVGPSTITPVSGDKAVQFHLPTGSKRVELNWFPPEPVHAERWYGYSVFIPVGYKYDSDVDTINQWHEVPDWSRGESWRSPPMGFGLVNHHYEFITRWDSRPVNTMADSWIPKGPEGGRVDYNFGAATEGVWTDWVFHVQWSYKSDGFIQVWRDGDKVLDRTGPNTYNDLQGNYFKFGIYNHSIESPVDKKLFFDEVRIGDGTATYADIAPRHGNVQPPPVPPSPPPPVGSNLIINGTTGNDRIEVSREAGGDVIAVINGLSTRFGTTDVAKIVVNGGDGNDIIELAPSINLNAQLNGGKGNDSLRGGAASNEFIGGAGSDTVDYSTATAGVKVTLDNAANDGKGTDNVRSDVENVIGSSFGDNLTGNAASNLFVGGGGNDTIKGGAGRDILIGGAGADKLDGEADEDIVAGGRLSYQGTLASLLKLQAAWMDTTRVYSARISSILSAAPGGNILGANDNAVDSLTGGLATDWFIKQPPDTLADRQLSETVTGT